MLLADQVQRRSAGESQNAPRGFGGLPGYKSPLLILHTENDGLIDISHAERNHRWAGSAQKQLVRFPHGNHNTIFRSNLSEYLEAVRSFIELVRM